MRKKLKGLAKKILINAPIKVGEKYGKGVERVGKRIKSELGYRKKARQPTERIDYKRYKDLTAGELEKLKGTKKKSIGEIFEGITKGKEQLKSEKGLEKKYNNLRKKNGAIFSSSGKEYSSNKELADALGIEPHEIDWSKIRKG